MKGRLEVSTTYGNGSWQEQAHQVIALEPDRGVENFAINLYPELKGQIFDGFGGAITESAAYVYSLMKKEDKEKLMKEYFSSDCMNYQMVRLSIDSCDFSLEHYEAMSDPEDLLFESFSMERLEKYIFPMLEDAQKFAKKRLEVMLSPWSPPAFMKTNGDRNHGGKLKEEYRPVWARYLCHYIKEFKKRGFYVKRISLQNEPKAVQIWDSCVFTAKEQRDFLVDFMYPEMVKNHLEDIEVFVWDHNKERVYEWMKECIDEKSDSLIAGAAFHWYSGDHFESLDALKRVYPNKKLILSESCIELVKFDGEDEVANALRLSHEIIGDLNHGMEAFYDWNLLLNEEGGPNHVENYCLAPFMYDTKRRKLKETLLAQHLRHFAKNLLPGSVEILSSGYTNRIDVTAFLRPDRKIALLLLNHSEEVEKVNLRIEGQLAELILYPKSITSGILD